MEVRPDTSEVAVLIPAAGQGTRLGGHRKQFRLLGEKPLLVQTLLLFERHPEVDHILVSTPAEAVEALTAELHAVGVDKLVVVVAGGETRQDSVGAALAAVPEEVGVVLVHDAVRPFVEQTLVSAVVAQVRAVGAAALALSVTDTLRRGGGGGYFAETVPRTGLYRMQTPQGFRVDWFKAAHEEANRHGWQATDDVDLVQRLGYPVKIVPGHANNIKITTRDDWDWAQQFWPAWNA